MGSGQRTFDIRHANIRALAFSEDGSHLVTASASQSDGTIRRWRTVSQSSSWGEIGDPIRTGGVVTGLVLSRDGKWIVSSGNRVATVWNAAFPEVAHTLNGHSDWVDALDVSPDSSKVATGSNDRTVRIWNILTWTPLLPPFRHDDLVRSVKFSPNGDRIATGTANGAGLRIYDAHTGSLLRTFSFSVGTWSTPIAWSTQGLFALSVNMIVRFVAETGGIPSIWTLPNGTANNFGSIALSRNGRFMASIVGNTISLWDPCTSTRISSDIQHSPQPWSIAISRDNRWLATGHGSGVTLRNLEFILPDYYFVDQEPVGDRADFERQIEALRDHIRLLNSRLDQSRCQCPPPQPNGAPQVQITPRVPDGTYRIKCNTGDLYLTRPQDGAATVVVRPLNQPDASQRWTVSVVANGTYHILMASNSKAPLSVGIRNALVTGRRSTTWTFEPRGDAYVIGNAANAAAIQLAPNNQSVSVFPRNNSPTQRWILERVTQ